ncbi:GNAT family N-acetyltransferase [Oceanobacillus kapialis]|uniref:GNAT family N-acetyltransferase n=1 Tax=Oceanobacillus kapialis TaxID=481353 RepID=A0ABW5Q438_9BACI
MYKAGKLFVRSIQQKDEGSLVKWLSNPTVLEFYEGRDKPYNLSMVREDFYGEEPDIHKCIVEHAGVSIGYIQFYEINERTSDLTGYDKKKTVYGMDQFIGEPSYWGKGIGTELVQSMLRHLLQRKLADVVVLDPQTTNERAIRCYEKCGFKKVRRLHAHEFHEGKYRDCWLMEYRKRTDGGNK